MGISFLTSLDAAAGVASGRFLFAKLANRRLAERLVLCNALNAPLGKAQARLVSALFKGIP